jgi:hypothetical protein
MTVEEFPSPLELYNEYHPNERFSIRVRYRQNSGHDCDSFIGGIPKDTEFMTVTSQKGWNSSTWEELQECYENEGFDTHLRKSSGTTRTRSGTCKHAPTQLYVW